MEKCGDCLLGVRVSDDADFLTESNKKDMEISYRKIDIKWATSGLGVKSIAEKIMKRDNHETLKCNFDLFMFCPDCGNKNTFDREI